MWRSAISVVLVDRGNALNVLKLNLWNWRTIVIAATRLGVLDANALSQMEPFCGGLDQQDARRLGKAFEQDVLPSLGATTRLLLDGTVTNVPDDGVFHRDPAQQSMNYSASREVLEAFCHFCSTCDGFDQ